MKSSGMGVGGGRSRPALQALTLFKTKNCLFCHPVKDKRPNFTTLIHFVLHKEFRGAFYINIMKLEFFFLKILLVPRHVDRASPAFASSQKRYAVQDLN